MEKRKYKGGAQKAREKKAKHESEVKARAESDGHGVTFGADYYRKTLGGPPPEDAIGTIAYANRAAGLMLHSILTDDAIETESDRRKMAKEVIAVIGMTGVKALYEQELKRLRKQLGLGGATRDGEQYTAEGRRPLRVTGADRRKQALRRPVSEVPPQEDGKPSP